jgi:hypothetical protein
MKQSTLFAVTLAALCLPGCDRNDPDDRGANRRDDRIDRADVDDVVEPGVPKAGPPIAVDDPHDHELAERGAPEPVVHPDTPATHATVDTPRDPGDPSLVDKAREARQAFAAASRRRLDQIERDLQELEQRRTKAGTDVREDMRQDKQRLEAELEKLGQQTEDAWGKAKGGFADALDRLEKQVKELRKDFDPAA